MPPSLIPDPTQLRLHCLTATDTVITVTACTKASEARCPLCTQPSTRVHSRYLRTLADLPWSGIAVQPVCRLAGSSVTTTPARGASLPNASRVWWAPMRVVPTG